MPVILGDKESIDTWLNGSSSKFNTLLKPYEAPDLVRAFLNKKWEAEHLPQFDVKHTFLCLGLEPCDSGYGKAIFWRARVY